MGSCIVRLSPAGTPCSSLRMRLRTLWRFWIWIGWAGALIAAPIPDEPFWQDLAVPLAGHRRFVRVIAPSAPWVFGAAGIAYAIMPTLVEDQLGSFNLAYATLLTVVTLGTGALVQPQVARINRVTGGRALSVGMSVMLVGVGLSVVTAVVLSPVLAFLTAVVLGAAYGVSVVAGLVEIQKISTAADLAGITGVYYSLTYIGFLLPVAFAGLSEVVGYPALLAGLFVVCALCLALVAYGMRRSVTE